MYTQDTLRYFDCIDVCKVRQGWSEVRLPGLLPPCAAADHVLAVLVTVVEPTEIDLSLFQEGSRNSDKSQRSPVDLCVALYRTGSVAAPQIGSLVVHSKRQLRGFVATSAFLEPGLYMIVCLAFNHWNCSEVNESITLYPPCVLAIHSSKRLLVEHITPSPFVLADALVSLTMSKGQRYEVLHAGLRKMAPEFILTIAVLFFLFTGTGGYDGVLLNTGMGRFSRHGGEPARRQVAPGAMQLPGQLQRRVKPRKTADRRRHPSAAQVGSNSVNFRSINPTCKFYFLHTHTQK